MTLTDLDIKNLDKVIDKLATNTIENTIPELLNGWHNFPAHDDPIDQTYRFYESFLIDNHICSIKKDWTKNALNGFKYLELDTEGYQIIHQKESMRDFIKRSSSTKNIKIIMGDYFENIQGTVINRSVISNSLNEISQRLGEEDAQLLKNVTNEIEKSGKKDAIENMEEFYKEIQKTEPKKKFIEIFLAWSFNCCSFLNY